MLSFPSFLGHRKEGEKKNYTDGLKYSFVDFSQGSLVLQLCVSLEHETKKTISSLYQKFSGLVFNVMVKNLPAENGIELKP
jgi:hypothetical protein